MPHPRAASPASGARGGQRDTQTVPALKLAPEADWVHTAAAELSWAGSPRPSRGVLAWQTGVRAGVTVAGGRPGSRRPVTGKYWLHRLAGDDGPRVARRGASRTSKRVDAASGQQGPSNPHTWRVAVYSGLPRSEFHPHQGPQTQGPLITAISQMGRLRPVETHAWHRS